MNRVWDGSGRESSSVGDAEQLRRDASIDTGTVEVLRIDV